MEKIKVRINERWQTVKGYEGLYKVSDCGNLRNEKTGKVLLKRNKDGYLVIDLYKEGIIPHIQVHDELDISVESPEQAQKIIEIMENAVKLEVPNKVDYESGDNWGNIK